MIILGIVGSPRKNGRTNMLIDAALEGAESKGATTKKVYLIDYNLKSFTGSGGFAEAYGYCPDELTNLCEEADAIALGAPVYWGDINGLTKNFMDTVRILNSNGKPGLGIAIAGGSGKGLISGVQTIYHFFFHKQMRGIDPTPVSRFNLQEALSKLRVSGANMADLSKEKTPFPGQKAEDRWPEVLAYYTSLKYLNCDPLDEFVMLSEQLIRMSTGTKVGKARADLDKALKLIDEGKRGEAARYAVNAYQTLYTPA